MAKFRKRPVVIDATQWFKNGDHPEDNCHEIKGSDEKLFLSEGKVVRYYRDPDDDGRRKCEECGRIMHDHGWIDIFRDGYTVCPDDWIITDIDGKRYHPCRDDLFRKTYESVD